MMNRELITKEGIMYEIINTISTHQFTNKDGNLNQQVLGMYVHENGGDRVLQRDNMLLICKQIEEATLLQLDQPNNFRILHHMRKQRIYKGCELESPLYWKVVKEMKTKQTDKSLINEYKTKRGKHSL